MGKIYKIKPEIENFILEEKKTNSVISCRVLATVVEEKFNVKISKSSINSIFKKAGLSMPVGRRPKKRRRRLELAIQPEVIKSLTAIEEKAELPTEKRAETHVEVPAPEAKVPSMQEQPAAIPLEEKPVFAVAEEVSYVKSELPSERECSGAILLKAVDFLVGGSAIFTDMARLLLNRRESSFKERTEALIYLQSLGLGEDIGSQNAELLYSIIGKKISLEEIHSYLNELQSDRWIASDWMRVLGDIFKEALLLQFNLPAGGPLYLDGQMHTIWSTPHIPYNFSSTPCNIKSYVNRYFLKNEPFILFTAPGYDTPSREFFHFLERLNSQEKASVKLSISGNKLEELEAISVELGGRRNFIFGLWPWQFVQFRKVKKLGEFKPFIFEPLNKQFYLAEIAIELTQPDVPQPLILKGAALKGSLSEKTRLLILSNNSQENPGPDALAKAYLSHWPNLEEAFQDYSRKIELFTYTGSSSRYLSTEQQETGEEEVTCAKAFFNRYLSELISYFKIHFLPPEYDKIDFPTVKTRFFGLKAVLKQENELTTVTFKPEQGFAFQKDLEYALRRLNEREINFAQESRLWFTV